ncbi:MAG: nucleotidyltransferase domain-containing protein, partial [Candidatus Thermoplasmatota archaeon]|nr:nucleotidyltransferase domain-containing protein [Candidatus Thermoplasmatota archaeon]
MIDLYSVVSRVSPTKEEEDRIREVTDLAVGRLNAYLRENNINAVPAVVGSSSRNTYLVHSLRSSDVDIFLVFPRDARMEDLKKFGLAAGHHILPEGVEKYAEHPYVNGFINGIKVDIVPCYAMDKGERKISAVDRTVLHDKYLKSVLTDDLRKEIRLFKAFLISAGVYGSEVSKAGFSGLVSELIIVRLGSFLGAVQYFSSRRGNIAIPESDKGIHGFHSPLVVMDPVDDTRNAAAAVSTENMARLKSLIS